MSEISQNFKERWRGKPIATGHRSPDSGASILQHRRNRPFVAAAVLSSQADRLVRNCTKIGTDALYMEIVMERSLRVGCGRTDKLHRSSDQRHRTAEKTRILNDARRSLAKAVFRAAVRRDGNSD